MAELLDLGRAGQSDLGGLVRLITARFGRPIEEVVRLTPRQAQVLCLKVQRGMPALQALWKLDGGNCEQATGWYATEAFAMVAPSVT